MIGCHRIVDLWCGDRAIEKEFTICSLGRDAAGKGNFARYAHIDGVVLRIAGKIFFPLLLSGWEGFGPIGVAMTLMTWSAVVGTGWVVCACAGAIIVERQVEDDVASDALNPMRYGEEPGLST